MTVDSQQVVTTTLLLGAATVAAAYYASTHKSKDPKDAGIPLFPGSMTDFLKLVFNADGPQGTLQIFRSLKDIVFKSPIWIGPPLYCVADSALARTILEKATTTKFDKANQFFVNTTNGMNFIATSGHRWKHVRKSTVAAFSSENIQKLVQVVDKALDNWIKDTLEGDDNNNEIDIVSEMNKITSNVICEGAFDYDLGDEERETMLAELQVCWREFGQEDGKNLLRQNPLTKWAFQGVRDGQKAAKQLHARCHKMLAQYRARIDKDETKAQPHKIIHMIHADPDYANDDERVSDMLAFVIAGFDTTANTLSFLFRELALNQEEETKLRERLRSSPEEARVAVKNVTREIMRLYPAAAASVRILGEDIPVPGNNNHKNKRFLPKGSLVLASYYSIQRDPILFGPKAYDFCPSRWNDPTPEQLRAVLAFSAGKRNCLGQSLALAEMHQVVARLCRDYRFEIVEAGKAENIVLFKPSGTILKMVKVAE